MNRQHDNLRRDLERRLERGEISFDEYRFMLAELARSLAPGAAAPGAPPPPSSVEDEPVFVSQGDWQTYLGDPEEESFTPPPLAAAAPAVHLGSGGGQPAAVPAPPRGGTSHAWEDRTFGNYQLEFRVARGGMGEIWRARDLVGERPVAIKMLPQELKHHADEMRRVKQAFDRVQALQHQNICPIYQLDWHDELGYFLVMKFLEAVTLSTYCEQYLARYDALPTEEVARLLRPVAAALDYAHDCGIVHRDIKPQNVMVSLDGRNVQVVDFDLATVIRGTVARATQSEATISGTFSYMSPEQWKAAALDGRSDQFSLAMVAYELLAGRLPFESPDPLILRHCVLEDDVPAIEGIHETVHAALTRALAKNPGERFETCTEFIETLAGAAGSSTAARSPGAPPPAAQPTRPNSPAGDTTAAAAPGIATFRAGGGSARRERLLGLRPAAGAPPSQNEARIVQEAAAKQLGRDAGSVTKDDLAGLPRLDLSRAKLTSLKPLEVCPGLEELNVAQTGVSDLTPLMNLPQLRELNLTATETSNLTPLRTLTRLQVLILDQSKVEDLTPLRRLISLRKLSLQNTRVQDVSAVGFLMQLASLDLAGSWVRDVQPLAMLRELKLLSLSRALVTDLSPLAELRSLKTLLLAGVSAADLTPLGGMTTLQCLSLRGTRIRNLEMLGALRNLRQLSIAGTEVVDFSLLLRFGQMEQLDLEGTTIQDLSVLEKMSGLKWLSLKETPVESLAPLAKLTQLEQLDLRGTRLPLREMAAVRAAHPSARIVAPDGGTS